MIFSFDTSIFVEIERYYIRSENTKLYNLLCKEILARRILVSEEVKHELSKKKKKNGLNKLDELKVQPEQTNISIQDRVKEIQERFPKYVDFSSTKNQADIFVIALALQNNCSVVSNEKANIESLKSMKAEHVNSKTKIPILCHLLGIKHFTFTQFVASFLP